MRMSRALPFLLIVALSFAYDTNIAMIHGRIMFISKSLIDSQELRARDDKCQMGCLLLKLVKLFVLEGPIPPNGMTRMLMI